MLTILSSYRRKYRLNYYTTKHSGSVRRMNLLYTDQKIIVTDSRTVGWDMQLSVYPPQRTPSIATYDDNPVTRITLTSEQMRKPDSSANPKPKATNCGGNSVRTDI